MRGKGSAFLPREKVTAKISSEKDPPIGFKECFVGALVILAARSGNPGALIEWNLFPNHVHGIVQIVAMTGVQPLNRRA